jgi:putative acetyltransferase
VRIVADDLTHPHVAALLAEHLAGMRATSPADSVHALDLDRLRAPGVAFFTAWDGDELLGCAALRDLGDGTAEVKSMRTAAAHQRRGVARALLDHLTGVARARGWRRLSLETGSGPAFAAPLALYRGYGFVDGPSYADYGPDPFLTFLHLDL